MTEKDWLDSQEFYELMQAYRHASGGRPNDVVSSFELVKGQLRQNFKNEYYDRFFYIGDLFIHQRTGKAMVCSAISKRESGTAVELSPYVRDQK